MAFKGVCSDRVFYALLVSFLSCLSSTESFQLKFPNDSQTITVENGVESNVDFFLPDFSSLNRPIRIIVQHQRSGGNYDKKCQIEHSKTSGCSVSFGPCQCVGEKSGSFQYRLKMIFTLQDRGSLSFGIVNHEQLFVTVNVGAVRVTRHPTKATTHRHEAMLITTSTPRPATISPTAIPSSTTTTTSPKVDVATAAATTHFVHDTPDPHLQNNNGDDGTEEDGTKDGENIAEESKSESEKTESSGSGLVMNVITISFLVLASQWGLI